jgi:phospholipase/carboxylesterase
VTILKSRRSGALSGKSKSLVVFVHGYGADGSDLISLSSALAPHFPDTSFVAPNAPHRCGLNPMGYEWFPIPMIDGTSEARAREAMYETAALFDAWLDQTMQEEEVASAETVLFGFSQGTMLSLHQGVRRRDQLAAIVGFSGRLLHPEVLAHEATSKPPILLVHGDMDVVVPPSDMPAAHNSLTEAGFEVDTHLSRGMGHGIAPDGLGRAIQFLQAKLPL